MPSAPIERNQQQKADELWQHISADPAQQQGIARMRERINKRIAAKLQQVS